MGGDRDNSDSCSAQINRVREGWLPVQKRGNAAERSDHGV